MRAGVLPALAAAVVIATAGASTPQAQPDRRVFPGGIEQVTVDVVVTDRKGNPVLGLGQDDFTVLDEGRPQAISSFEVVRPQPASTATALPRPPVSVNTGLGPPRGRLFVVVFDDMHLSPLHARRAQAAVAAFLEKGTEAGDRALLVATGGGAWWTTDLASGRQDLLELAKRLEGRRILDNALERLTDFEAVRIFVYQDVRVALRVLERLDRYATRARNDMARNAQQHVTAPGAIPPYVEARASEAYFRLKSRTDATLAVLERCFDALSDSRERKSVLLVSEGFAHDPSNDAFRRVAEAARRANGVLYFVDVRGLAPLSQAYSAEFGAALPAGDLLQAIADVGRDGDGAEALARDTGGFSVRNTNEFTEGTVRVGRESRSYYLLGFNPGAIPHDGRFRKLEVRVRGKGLVVRARRGYHAPRLHHAADAPAAGAAPAATRRTDPELQKALDAPAPKGGIPLVLTAYVLHDAAPGKARVVLAAEADVGRVAFAEGAGRATLDTVAVVSHRESGEIQRRDVAVELERRREGAGGAVWYSFIRDFDLPAGRHQAKLIVRDPVGRRLGSVIHEFDVPALDRLRVTTPVLTDSVDRTPEGGVAPRTRVRRTFAPGASLYCAFDVFAAGRGRDGLPRVKAGHAVRRVGAGLLGETPPHTIQPTSIGALSRLIQIPLSGLGAGDFELVLTVLDEITGDKRELVEPFSVSAPAVAGTR